MNRIVQLRKAALRRWGPHDTPGKIALRLNQPTEYIHAAISEDVRRVLQSCGRGVTAAQIAADLSLPRDFVTYCIRRAHASADSARRRKDKARDRWIKQATADA
jgi:site-specific recombinase XerC